MPRLTKKMKENTGTGGRVTKRKKAKFPDLSGDGRVTMKDILIGRGVVKKKDGGLAEATAKLKAQG